MSGSANDHNAVKKEMLEQLFAKGCQGNDGMTADQLVDLFASAGILGPQCTEGTVRQCFSKASITKSALGKKKRLSFQKKSLDFDLFQVRYLSIQDAW